MRLLTIIVITVFLFVVLAPAEAQESADVELNIAEQPLSWSLREVADSFDLTIAFYSESTEGLQGSALDGDYTSKAALDTLLAETNLEYTFINDSSVAVRPIEMADQGGASDSKNSLPTPMLMAQTQTSPTMSTEIRNGRDDDPAEAQEEESSTPLEEIIVVGTNIRGVENPTVPVLTFGRQDIALSGAATVDDFLRTIPQNFASETQLTANSGNPFTSNRNRSQGTSVDLRGLGAGSTLVLLNGRRLPFAGEAAIVDVNVIPLGAIERVEILTDGATAIYGSDAVGGVINFVTRDDYKGLDINARYGTVTDGSMEDWSVGGTGGFSWGSGSAFAGIDYQEEKPLLMRERGFVDLSLPGRENATFGSDSERFGLSANVRQEVGSRLRLRVNGLYSETTSESTDATDNINANPAFNVSEQTVLTINPSVEYDITDSITVSFFADTTHNRTDFTSTETLSGTVRRTDYENDLTVYEGRVSGQAVDLPGGVVSFSLGGLYRSEEFLLPGTDTGSETSGERDIWASYGELLVPVFGEANALPLVKKLELSVAGRYEDYSDFGDSFDPKIGLYWEVNESLSFRASYSEAFRAPDISSINARQLVITGGFPASFATGQRPDEVPGIDDFFGLGPAYIYVVPLGGNPDLNPERAKTWSAGFTYEPDFFKGLSLGGNFFDISYTDRLENISFISALQNPAFFLLADLDPDIDVIQAIFDRGASGEIEFFNSLGFSPEEIQILFSPAFTNVAERDIRGLDLNFGYTRETEFGELSVGANATYLIDYIGRLTALAPSTEEINTLYRPVNLKLRGNLSWSYRGFTAFTAVNYVDGYRDDIDESIADSIASWTTVDLALTFDAGNGFGDVAKDVRVAINVTNLLDEDPPFVATPFGLNFDSANATPWGRQVSFTIAKSF